MKVLLVNTLDRGGAANACIRLHLGLLREGIDSKLLVLKKTNNDIPKSYSFIDIYNSVLRRLGLKLQVKIKHRIDKNKITHLPKGTEDFQFPTSIYDITEHSLFQEADIINLHWVTGFLDWKSFFSKCNKPVIWTLHDMLPFTGGYHYQKGFPFESYQPLIDKNLKVKKKALKNKNIDIITPSTWLLNESKQSELFEKYQHHLVHYGLDDTIFKCYPKELARQVFDITSDKKVLLFVADSITNKRKGFKYLLDAIPFLEEDIEIVAIGQHKSENNSPKTIRFLDNLKDERLMALIYSAADLFVIPSIEDNLPNTVLESIICGTPVVGFNIGGIPDMVNEGENGFLCDEINAKSLAKIINKALNYPFDRRLIRKHAVVKFKLEVQARQYIDLYQSLID